MVIVADTSPLNYLILIEAVHVLPTLYGRIIIPPEVLGELGAAAAPPVVRKWTSSTPAWLEVRAARDVDQALPLDAGERAAIALAKELSADRLLIDDREGREVASRLGIPVAGTLAVLRDAATDGLIVLATALDRLRHTTFRAAPQLYDAVLSDFERTKSRTAPGENLS